MCVCVCVCVCVIIVLCQKIAISPELNLRWTSDQSVNSSLSVAVQEKKNQSALSFSVEAWRPDEFREHLFPNSEIETFDDFRRNSRIFKQFSGAELKRLGPHIFYSIPLYTYLSPCNNRICKMYYLVDI